VNARYRQNIVTLRYGDRPTGWYPILQCQRIRRNIRETWIAVTQSVDTTSMVDYQPDWRYVSDFSVW